MWKITKPTTAMCCCSAEANSQITRIDASFDSLMKSFKVKSNFTPNFAQKKENFAKSKSWPFVISTHTHHANPRLSTLHA